MFHGPIVGWGPSADKHRQWIVADAVRESGDTYGPIRLLLPMLLICQPRSQHARWLSIADSQRAMEVALPTRRLLPEVLLEQ
jgi:hypothetical protein